MHRLLMEDAVRYEQERHDGADVVLVGIITGEWGEFRRSVAQGVWLEGEHPDFPDRQPLAEAIRAFRYERGLIAAAELEEWLSGRSLTLSDLRGVQRRRLLRQAFAVANEPDVAESAVGAVIEPEGLCAAVFERWARRLLTWHAAREWITQLGAASVSAQSSPPVRAVSLQDVLADRVSGLGALDERELQARLDQMTRLLDAYARFRVEAVDDEAVSRRLSDRVIDWTVVRGQELTFDLEGAALETVLRVAHDGETLAQVAQDVGLEPVAREFEVRARAADFRPMLLSSRPGDLVGPWHESDRWRVLQLDARVAPTAADDPAVRERARDELMDELLQRTAAGKAEIIGHL